MIGDRDGLDRLFPGPIRCCNGWACSRQIGNEFLMRPKPLPLVPRVKVWLEAQGCYAFGYGIAEILQAIQVNVPPAKGE